MRNDTCELAGKENTEHLCRVAKIVLNKRGRYGIDLPLLWELTNSYEFNNKKILRKIRWYKIGGYLLLITIPIFSSLIAVAVNLPESLNLLSKWANHVVPYLSILLAALTVLNTAFKPGSRFPVCCRIGLDLFHWRLEFLEGLETLESLDDKSVVKYLKEAREKFRKIQEADITLALPEQT